MDQHARTTTTGAGAVEGDTSSPGGDGVATTSVRSRRALLGAAVGAAAAGVASAVANPAIVRGAATTMQTETENTATAATGLVRSNGGDVLQVSDASTGSLQAANAMLHAVATGSGTAGLYVERKTNGGGTGISVDASTVGVFAGVSSDASFGTNTAVWGYGGFIGLDGSTTTDNANSIGVRGSSGGATGIGVQGLGDTGVMGWDSYTDGIGVHGLSGSGHGVHGKALTGVGGYFEANSGSTALQAVGKVKFNRSGKATILAGKSYVDVTVSGGLTSSSLAFANLRTYRSGIYVAAVTPNTTSGKIRIRLNKAVGSSTSVAWFVLG